MIRAGFRLVNSICWQVATEIIRHHHREFELRLYHGHPSGGMGRIISLSTASHVRREEAVACTFHVSGKGTMWVSKVRGCSEPCSFEVEIIDQFLETENLKGLVNELARKLGLPSRAHSPETTPAVLCFRLMSAMISRHWLDAEFFDNECGWYDHSGTGPCSTRLELKAFPTIQHRVNYPDEDKTTAEDVEAAATFWLVGTRNDEWSIKPRGLFDLRGIFYPMSQPATGIDLMKRYNAHGRELLPLVRELEGLLVL